MTPGSGSRDSLVLRALRAATVHLLPGDIAAQLEVPREEIERAVESLRAAGFDIESRPGLGLRLKASPDRILADDLWARISPTSWIREILVFEETSSTNDVALRLGREGHPGGVMVFAERQTAGRGRFGRRWVSADHEGLWFSLLLRPPWEPARWPLLTTWAGVAVASALERFAKAPVKLKWPNDVQISGRKVAGILFESATDRNGQLFAVGGIGVNVNQAEFPAEIQDTAISARQSAGEPVDRPALAAALIEELARLWTVADENFERIVSQASEKSSLLGSWVTLHSGTEIFEGVAEALDSAGHLLLRQADGNLTTMASGEVTSHSAATDIRGM